MTFLIMLSNEMSYLMCDCHVFINKRISFKCIILLIKKF